MGEKMPPPPTIRELRNSTEVEEHLSSLAWPQQHTGKVQRHHTLQLGRLLTKRQKITSVGEEVETGNVCITFGENVKELKESL